MATIVNGKSNIGILHMVNKTAPIDWYSKSISTVETSPYGTEFCAARVAVDQIVDIRYTLRMLGVPILEDEASYLFVDNLNVVNSSTLPGGQLMKRNHIQQMMDTLLASEGDPLWPRPLALYMDRHPTHAVFQTQATEVWVVGVLISCCSGASRQTTS